MVLVDVVHQQLEIVVVQMVNIVMFVAGLVLVALVVAVQTMINMSRKVFVIQERMDVAPTIAVN